jgi:MFS family permease
MNIIESFDAEIAKNYKFNFTVNLFDVAFFMFASSFISSEGIYPIYVIHFTQNPIIIGLISVIATAGYLIPQLFTANRVELAPIKKYFPFNLGLFFERIPIFLLAPATFFFATGSPVLALTIFFILLTWYTFGAGLLIVGWQDMIAKIIPVRSRGKFFGISNFIGNFAGILGATTVSWLLSKYDFPDGFVYAFIFAGVFIFISWIFLGLTREPRDPITKPAISNLDYFKALPKTLRSNPNFQRFLITQVVKAFGTMATVYLLVYAIERWSIPDGQAASYSIALLIGKSLANLFFGFLADRNGHKIVLEISIMMNIFSFILALIAPSPIWFYAIFALRGMNQAGNFISGLSLPFEFCEPHERPTYIGLASTIPGIAFTIAPLLAGSLAKITGYPTLFVISTVIAILSYGMMRWFVQDPRYLAAS